MPSSMLFAVNNEGKVFGLSTNGTKWREFPYLGLDFKHLSAVPNFMWAVGGDRQVYVHVHGLDIPIRVKEEAYENQRWNPIDGFTKRLLPTDRYQFSNQDGSEDRSLEKIRVPSMAWQWEGEWHLETTFNGEPLDHDGWTYAVDFPTTYYPSKQWTSCVRRRKWVRSRRYCAMNSWCAIAPLHKDPTQEPFIDVSVGGHMMTGVTYGALQVWAVTAHGRVIWRRGVGMSSPEGTKWNAIPLPSGSEVKNVSCGPTGSVWATLWNGHALVRTGICSTLPMGSGWCDVESPEEGVTLAQISVGTNAVWAVSSDKRVWFRKGVKAEQGNPEELLKGTGWVEMVGDMAMVSVTYNDQVFGVGSDDRNIYYRLGVTEAELTGKRWKPIQAAVQVNVHGSTLSLGHQSRSHRSTASLLHGSNRSLEQTDWLETSRSAPTSLRLQPDWQKSQPSSLPASEGSIEEPYFMNNHGDGGNQRKLTAWSPIRSVGSLLGLEANPETDPNADWDGEVYPERESVSEPGWSQEDTLWSWIEAGALFLNPSHLPHWFLESSSCGVESAPWRTKILNGLKSNITVETKGFEGYDVAIEMTSCVNTIECRCCLPGQQPSMFDECIVELEWVGNQGTALESGSLSILSLDRSIIKYQISVSDVVCVSSCSEPGNPRIAVHTTSTSEKGITPLKLQFSGDVEFDEWMGHLTSVSCQMACLEGPPGTNSIWATTRRGEVFVFDPVTFQKQQRISNGNSSVELHSKESKTPWSHVLYNGFTSGSVITIYGHVPDTSKRFAVNLECDNSDNVALHFNPRFEEGVLVRNCMKGGSWGSEEKLGALTIQPGHAWSVDIACEKDGFKIWVNGMVFGYFEHRVKPENITNVRITGETEIHKVIYESKQVVVLPKEMVWRQMGGHLVQVESCAAGITWGISADHTPYVYSGGWGGLFLYGLEKSSFGIHPMTDTYCCYVYENQRWNPLSGFTSRGLPTDRPMWSDSTGRKKRSKETTRVLSMHWQWITDWQVDYGTPGGVDSDGWQYAVDFSTSYHAKKNLTDYVRRRRWSRKCKLTTCGPWLEVGNSKLVDISLQLSPGLESVCIWAIAQNGDVLFRKGVTKNNPLGDSWEHVPCEQSLSCISCGCNNQVWAVTQSGSTLWRFGITTSNPIGEIWEDLDPPKGSRIKKVSVGGLAVWALDHDGHIFVRREVSPVFPEGSHWQPIKSSTIDGFQDISASGNEVWAITGSGAVCRRTAVNAENPTGFDWIEGLENNWVNITTRSNVAQSSSYR